MFDLRQLKLMFVVRVLLWSVAWALLIANLGLERALGPTVETPVVDSRSIDDLRVELIKATVRAAYWEGYEAGYHAHRDQLLGVPECQFDKVWP